MPKKLTVILKTSSGFRKYRNVYARSFDKLVSHLEKRQNVEVLWANFYNPDTRQQVASWTKTDKTINPI